MLADLQNKEVIIEIFKWPITEFISFHQKYINTFTLGVIAYIGAVVGIWLSPGGGSIALNTRTGQFWVFPLAGIVIVFFLCIEYFIHGLMAKSKYCRLEAAQSLLKINFDAWLANPSDDKSKLIDALTDCCENIKKEQEWPLNFTALFTVVATLLLPTIKTVFDIVKQV